MSTLSFVSAQETASNRTRSSSTSSSLLLDEDIEITADEQLPVKVYTTSVLNETIDLHFKPYTFQINLAANSCKGVNSIICVRTGSGKTLIAALVCKYWYTMAAKKNELNKFKCVFIVPTRNLVQQQAASFKNAFSAEHVQEIDEKVDANKLKEVLGRNGKHVYFMTHQKLLNTLEAGLVRISDLSLLVLDECHHTYENHPYNKIMEFYFRYNIYSGIQNR